MQKRSRGLWRDISAAYELSEADYELLRSLCEVLDRLDEVKGVIDAEGLVVGGSKGQPRPHPLLGAERDCRITAARLIREMRLDADALPDPRIPRR